MDLFRPEWKSLTMFKHVALLVRQEGMSHGEFVDYWQTNHTPIARDLAAGAVLEAKHSGRSGPRGAR